MTRPGLLAGLLLVAVLAGCRDDRHEYPAEVVESFITNCEARADQSNCHCAIDRLREAYSYEQFQALEKRLGQREAMQEMADVVDQCR